MNALADSLIAMLVPFLIVSAIGLMAMVVGLVFQRGVDEWQGRRDRLAVG
ncbi:MAG: hypothetical protein WCP29_15245 [Acidobacteriota bacterium]